MATLARREQEARLIWGAHWQWDTYFAKPRSIGVSGRRTLLLRRLGHALSTRHWDRWRGREEEGEEDRHHVPSVYAWHTFATASSIPPPRLYSTVPIKHLFHFLERRKNFVRTSDAGWWDGSVGKGTCHASTAIWKGEWSPRNCLLTSTNALWPPVHPIPHTQDEDN